MTSAKQTDANHRNAQKSTGPRTAEGKNRSRLNAFKHGLTGQLDIMTEEQKEAHDTFIARIVLSLKPADALENQLAHSIAESYWRMNRVAVIENTLLAEGNYVVFPHNQDREFTDLERALSASRGFMEHPERFNLLSVYEIRLHRKAQAELKQLREMQAERRAAEKEARNDAVSQTAGQAAPQHDPRTNRPAPVAVAAQAAAPQNAESEVPADPNGFVFSTAEFPLPPSPNPPEFLPADGLPTAA